MTAPRRLTARQLATALAEIDQQLAGLREIEALFRARFASESVRLGGTADAWNATHDAIAELQAHRDVVAANERPLTFAEAQSLALIHANID
jgi:hypothetical protein